MRFPGYKNILRNKFLRNVLILSSGTVLGQAIMVLLLPVLTRLYSPEDFGILGVYMSLLMVISVAACLRFDLATPIANSEFEALNLLVLGVIAATLLSGALAVLVLFFPKEIIKALEQPKLEKFLWLIPLGVWLASMYSAIQFWAVREKNFASIAKTQLTRAIGSSATQLLFGIFGGGLFGLLFGYMLYGGIGTIGLVAQFFKAHASSLKSLSKLSLKQTFIGWRRFPLYSVPESLLNTAAVNLPTVIIAAIASPREAGYLLLAQRIISIPVGLLGGSLSRVYLSESGEKQKNNLLFPFTKKIMLNLLKAGAAPFLVIAIISPFAFPYVFGESWHRAGLMVSWLTPAMALQFVVSPVGTLLHATQNNKLALYLQIIGVVLTLGGIYIAAKLGVSEIFEVFAISLAVYYSCYLAAVLFVLQSVRGQEAGFKSSKSIKNLS